MCHKKSPGLPHRRGFSFASSPQKWASIPPSCVPKPSLLSNRLVVSAVDGSGNEVGPVEVAPPPPVLSKPVLATKPVLGEEEAPGEYTFDLGQNLPNPFNPVTMIRYSLGDQSEVRLVIYNVLGQQVRVLVDRVREVGQYEVMWDGRDGLGRGVSSGLYLYRLQAGSNLAVRKMLFTK